MRRLSLTLLVLSTICYVHCLSFSFSDLVSMRSLYVKRQLPDLYEASVPELQAGLDAGDFTSVDLVKVLTI